jgi:quinol monooxygenase YgiN
LQAIEVDALHSETDEARCLHFNVLQDTDDENLYYFYEVYESEAARLVNRATPHYEVWNSAAHTLDGPTERMEAMPVFAADPGYWAKRS